ncbi:proline dehydrogenase family protein [Sediminitomix flava]|uniref:L-proline dehydrogenase n=1 Tax=Sediminitomix flava TaxID=379075 RepID=A0A315Z4X5_SEDFL|nr:proline dehydrogenase family protein [Sediminitomix flava]PWJ38472.1 L-proline dehydrogenase [Sediminitomix flava]
MVNKTHVNFEDTKNAFILKNDQELAKSYALFAAMDYPSLVKFGTSFLNTAFKIHLPFVKSIVKHTIFEQFCGGEDIQDCKSTIKKLYNQQVGTILDYSVEGKEDDSSFEATTNEIIRTIELSAKEKAVPFSVFKVTGLLPISLLQKVQEGKTLTPEERNIWEKGNERILRICQTAYNLKVRLFIDAEETWIQQPIDNIAIEMMERFNQESPIIYNTYQMYVAAKYDQLVNDHANATKNGYYFGAKLVRGAYMEKERERATEMGYKDPIQPNKEATDRDFDRGLEHLISNHENVALCCATHNEDSSQLLVRMLRQKGITPNDPNFFFAQLFGMSDHISLNLSITGYNVAKYVPYGPVEETMPYLFRRAEENTSISGQSSREFLLIKKEMQRRRNEK